MLNNIKQKIVYKMKKRKQPEIDVIALKERVEVKKWVSQDYCYAPPGDRKSEKEWIVGLLHCEETSYSMVHSLYYAFEADSECKPIVILQGKGYKNQYRELEKQMKERGMRYEFDYNCVDIKLAVLIVHHIQLPPTEDVKKIVENSFLKIAVLVGVISYDRKGEIKEDYIKSYQVTEIFCEKSVYEKNIEYISKGVHLYATGNPKFDCIFDAYHHKVVIPEHFKKLKDDNITNIFLWTTDHNGSFKMCSPDVSFDLYADTVFHYVKEHKDIGLIFRPYRTYVDELLRYGLWTEEQVAYFKHYCNNSKNIVWDEEPDYSISYSLADAILADPGCGIICTALPLMKPIGITLRWDMDMKEIISHNKEILDSHYLISSTMDMLSFIQMVREERNFDISKRKEICRKYVTHFDGKNGERIKNIIKERYYELDRK